MLQGLYSSLQAVLLPAADAVLNMDLSVSVKQSDAVPTMLTRNRVDWRGLYFLPPA